MIRDETTGYRIRYNRFADGRTTGTGGPKEFATEIKDEVQAFLKENLKLTLNQEKTKIVPPT